jgi:hypothetical protein
MANSINLVRDLKIFSSVHVTEEDGYEDKEVMVKRGGFWERIFDPDPTLHLWDDYKLKTIRVPKRKPAMYKIRDMIVGHPELIEKLINSLDTFSTSVKETTFYFENYTEFLNSLDDK